MRESLSLALLISDDDMPEGGTAIIVVERITQIDEGIYRTCIKMVVRNYPQVGKPQLLTSNARLLS